MKQHWIDKVLGHMQLQNQMVSLQRKFLELPDRETRRIVPPQLHVVSYENQPMLPDSLELVNRYGTLKVLVFY